MVIRRHYVYSPRWISSVRFYTIILTLPCCFYLFVHFDRGSSTLFIHFAIHLLSAIYPLYRFQTRNIHETYRRIRKMRYQWPDTHTVSWMARDLISNIFTDPTQRLNLSEIESHDFFTKSSIPRHLPLSILHSRPSTASLMNLNGNQSDQCSATENISPNIENTKALEKQSEQCSVERVEYE